jgi:peptide/nickel transport system permease protein/oligopeptide transport system permease protein
MTEPAAMPLRPSASRRPVARAWRRFRRNRAAVASGSFLILFLMLILAWPWLASHPADAISDAQFQPPSRVHWLGTDVHGRDLLSRTLNGARFSLLAGAIGGSTSLVIGVLWGAVAGYAGGRCDRVLMRIVDVLFALPTIILVIVLVTLVDGAMERLPDSWSGGEAKSVGRMLGLFIGLGAVSWLTMARIVRGQVLSLRTRPFVEASRALGASHGRILLSHILPNVAGLVVVYLALSIPAVMLYESFLSYLGLGIQPPAASLGSLIAEGATQINPIRIYWWIIVFPAATLASVLLALNLLSDGLRDAVDPRAGG